MEDAKRPEPVDITTGSRVRSARVARGLSQAALAEALGVSFQQVQKYENGSNRISASRLVQIADILGVSAVSFIDGLGQFSSTTDTRRSDHSFEGADRLIELCGVLPAPMRAAVLQLAQSLADGLATASAKGRSRQEIGRRGSAQGGKKTSP